MVPTVATLNPSSASLTSTGSDNESRRPSWLPNARRLRAVERRALVVLLATVALIIAACGGDSDAASPTQTPVVAEGGEASAAGAEPVEVAPANPSPTTPDGPTVTPQVPTDAPSSDEPPPPQSPRLDPTTDDDPPVDSTDEADPPPDDTDDADDADDAVLPETPTPYDNANALRILETLTVTIGERVQGTSGERDAAAFLTTEFESAGYAVEQQAVPLESRRVAELSVLAAGSEVDGEAFTGSPAGDLRAPLVRVPGLGEPGDFAEIEVQGAIVLLERGVLFFTDKIANAADAGAVGVIIYNNEAGLFSGTLDEPAAIPAVAISRESGLNLLEEVDAGAATAQILIRFDELSGQSQNIVARNPTGVCRVWVGGHYDTVVGVTGANDNGSGSSLVVELARAYAGSAAGRQVCFVGFGAEEAVASSPGILGSRIFVQSLVASGELAGVQAMLNLDVAAIGTGLILVGDGPLVEQASAVAVALDIAARPGALPGGSGSDHLNFAQAGVPVIFPTLLGGPIHTPADNFGAAQPERLASVGELAHGILGCLAADAGAGADAGAATAAACPLAADD